MLFRARIALVAALVILGGTVLTAMFVSGALKDAANASVDARVTEAQAAFSALERIRGIEVTADAARFAREDESAQVFEKGAGDPQRQAAFAAVEVWNTRLAREGHKADIVAILGANGHVVARDLNIGVMYDDDLKSKYPSVGKALDGTANKDLWLFDGHMYRVAVAPIRSKAGQVVGAMVVGYVTSAKDAAADRKKLGAHVAYFFDGKIHASSFSKEGGLESAEEKEIAQQVFDPNADKPSHMATESALKGDLSHNFEMMIGGEKYIAAEGPLPGNHTKSKSGFIVLASLSTALEPIAKVQALVYALGALGFLVMLGVAIGTALRFVRPLDRIETGVAEVINGNHEYTFEATSPDFDGLANSLNLMVARLTGRPDPSDDDSDSPGGGGGGVRSDSGPIPVWNSDGSVDAAVPAVSPENLRIAAEPEAEYFKRTFDEYVAARKANGESVEGLALESFIQKLKGNEEQLKTKYSASRVRFKVVVKDKVTTLKPIPIP